MTSCAKLLQACWCNLSSCVQVVHIACISARVWASFLRPRDACICNWNIGQFSLVFSGILYSLMMRHTWTGRSLGWTCSSCSWSSPPRSDSRVEPAQAPLASASKPRPVQQRSSCNAEQCNRFAKFSYIVRNHGLDRRLCDCRLHGLKAEDMMQNTIHCNNQS